MTAKCNEHGVYWADEMLSLPRDVKGWRGGALGEIRLSNLGTHWLWATSFQLWSGDCCGASSPLVDRDHYRAPTREAAIEAASQHLREQLQRRHSESKDAKAVLAWLETLTPDQLDLFAA